MAFDVARIGLGTADLLWATWRDLPPPPPVTTEPDAAFDAGAAGHRLLTARLLFRGLSWSFAGADLRPTMSRAEARYWLECILTMSKGTQRMHVTPTSPKAMAVMLAKKPKLPPIALAEVKARMSEVAGDYPPEMGLVLTKLFSPREVLELYLEQTPHTSGYEGTGTFLDGLRIHVVPQLSASDRAALARRIRPALAPARFPSDYYEEPPGELVLATMLGMHDELLAIVASWADDRYRGEDWHDAYHMPQRFVLGLGSAALVDEHMRRLGLRLRRPEYVRAWLAHTELAGLDYVAHSVIQAKNKELAASLASALACVHAPEAVAPMLEVAVRSKAPAVAAEWFEAHAAMAVPLLRSLAEGRGALATAAKTRAEELARIAAPVTGGAASSKPARASLAKRPKWLTTALASAATLRAVDWLDASILPPLEIAEGALAMDDVSRVLAALAASTLEAPHALVTALRAHATPASCDAFAWRVFEKWLDTGGPPKERWALFAVGLLGGDASAVALAGRVREWPGESQHRRAVLGLEVLGAIGSDVALLHLSAIAEKVKFQALRQRANEAMDAIARARKLTRDALEDRIVPSGGFGADGKRTLSFGARAFDIVLGTAGEPRVRMPDGTVRADLPKPGKGDDAARAAEALAEWKALKKTLRDVVKIQSARLEQAMVKGRSWSQADFETLLVRHPLMRHLVRPLVWGASTNDELRTFRVTEDGFADARDRATTLAKTALVRIVHPLDLDADVLNAWSQVLADYELVPPFPQLGRAVHALRAGEAKATDLAPRVAEKEWGASAFAGRLRTRGWNHGEPQDSGFVSDHTKVFVGADVTAVIEHTGYAIGGFSYADPQRVSRIYFLAGSDPNVRYSGSAKPLALSRVDAKVVSEVLGDLLF